MQEKWLVVIPPEGAARLVTEYFIPSFGLEIGPVNLKTFDTKTYITAFHKLLAKRDDNMVVDIINQQILIQSIEFDATHVLVMALCPVTLFILNLLKKLKITTVHWFYEDYRRATYWKDVLAGYDHFIGFQHGILEQTCAERGVKFNFLAPGTAYKQQFNPDVSKRKVDVAFIGIPSTYRIGVLETLVLQGISVSIGGSGWGAYTGSILQPYIQSDDWVAGFEANQIYQSAKIGLNLSFDDPDSDRVNTHISPRVYDIMNNGAWLATEDVALTKDILPGFAYNTFHHPSELSAIIQNVLTTYNQKLSHIQNNFNLVSSQHSYKNRAKQILSLVRSSS